MSRPVSAEPYDGRHVIADLHSCSAPLDEVALVETMLRDAAEAAGATVLDVRLHHFGPGQGVTGVAILAESHISIHTWPEHCYAALDFFLCGRTNDIDAALGVCIEALEPERVRANAITRGYGAELAANARPL